jgi:hypothetical protein
MWESNEVSQDVLNAFKEKFSKTILAFEEKEVFNMDECGLLFQVTPDKRHYQQKETNAKMAKNTKERFTVLLPASFTCEKLPPSVTGTVNQL